LNSFKGFFVKLTPRNKFPYPEEREEPFYDTFRAGMLAEDNAHWANADNGNLVFWSNAEFSWDAPTDTLSWDDVIYVSGLADSFPAHIPAGSMVIRPSEVVFFQMPRFLQAVTALTLYRGNRIFLDGARLHDLRLFVMRRADTVYFQGQLSMTNGQTGPLFGGGLGGGGGGGGGGDHDHQTPLIIQPGAGSSGPFAMGFTSGGTPPLEHVDVFRNGQLLRAGAGNDYLINLVTGSVTLNFTTLAPDVLTFWRRTGN